MCTDLVVILGVFGDLTNKFLDNMIKDNELVEGLRTPNNASSNMVSTVTNNLNENALKISGLRPENTKVVEYDQHRVPPDKEILKTYKVSPKTLFEFSKPLKSSEKLQKAKNPNNHKYPKNTIKAILREARLPKPQQIILYTPKII